MAEGNSTWVAEFILLGFSVHREIEITLFLLILAVYALTLVGNIGMISLIRLDSRLHTPMYFFLSNLAFVDLCYSSSVAPKFLQTLLTKHKSISFYECATQLGFFCSDTRLKEIPIFIFAGFNMISSLTTILITYLYIVAAVLRIQSAEGRCKAFSTCASHLTAVTIFYGTLIFIYLQPKANHSLDTDKMASVFYTMVIPMLNPMIYSLRNQEVKNALRKAIEKVMSCI
ncbi:PREDICTED: olfactory receptor 1038-like [Galeopterus variegatus]|uniref:Olfactory receptor 1038-like n=1 Tax=Galeopterus variegatus TaxID=482537 RepID=A0ABM0SJP6_GALVR|nr:PREDICTED: olfactory receptor 1038-like [Galeopterus variegatus]